MWRKLLSTRDVQGARARTPQINNCFNQKFFTVSHPLSILVRILFAAHAGVCVSRILGFDKSRLSAVCYSEALAISTSRNRNFASKIANNIAKWCIFTGIDNQHSYHVVTLKVSNCFLPCVVCLV